MFLSPVQVKKTWGATLTTLQDMTVLDDYDVSQSFTHSPSSESVKSSVSDGYLNKPSLAKRRANQQETELFYFTVREQRSGMFRSKETRYTVNSTSSFFFDPQKFREYLEGSNLISKLQAKHDILKKALAEGKTIKINSFSLVFGFSQPLTLFSSSRSCRI